MVPVLFAPDRYAPILFHSYRWNKVLNVGAGGKSHWDHSARTRLNTDQDLYVNKMKAVANPTKIPIKSTNTNLYPTLICITSWNNNLRNLNGILRKYKYILIFY